MVCIFWKKGGSKIEKRIIKNVVLMFLGKSISLMGSYLYNFAISLYVLKMTGSGLSFSLSLVAGTLPRVIFGPFSGVLCDNFSRKKIVVFSDLISFATLTLFYFVFDPSKLNLLLVLTVNFILAICNIFEDVSFNASMPAIAGRQNLTRVNSINSGITSLSSIAGPFIGGIIFGFVNLNFFIMANALSFLSAAILELLINFNLFPEEAPEIQKKALNPNLFFSELKEGFSFIRSQKTILIIFSAAVFINFFFNFGINVPFPYIINNVIGLSPSQFGILSSFFPAGMLMGSLVLALLPERKNLALTLYISLLTISAYIFITGFIVLPFLLKVLSKNFYFFANIFLILVAGISSSFANIPILSLLQKNIPSDLRGRVFGLISSMSSLMEPVGMFLAGLLVDNVPVYILPLTSAVFLALLTNYIYFGLRSEA